MDDESALVPVANRRRDDLVARYEKEDVAAAQFGCTVQQLDIVLGAGAFDPVLQQRIDGVGRTGANNRNLHATDPPSIMGMVELRTRKPTCRSVFKRSGYRFA